jgi:hypothetical protein
LRSKVAIDLHDPAFSISTFNCKAQPLQQQAKVIALRSGSQ